MSYMSGGEDKKKKVRNRATFISCRYLLTLPLRVRERAAGGEGELGEENN